MGMACNGDWGYYQLATVHKQFGHGHLGREGSHPSNCTKIDNSHMSIARMAGKVDISSIRTDTCPTVLRTDTLIIIAQRLRRAMCSYSLLFVF